MKKDKKPLKYQKPEIVSMDRLKQMSLGDCSKGKVAVFKPE